MAQRDDITIDWFLSPRIIRIEAPSTEITIQDLHDTVREREQRIENIIYNEIIASAGKEELGGGVKVGVTTTLLNAKIAFDARKISVSSGTVTSDDLDGRVLTDTNADFFADGITQGAWVVNLTDNGSVASVVDILNSTQILTDFLADGYDNQFETGDSYKVWNVEQVNITGGNAVAVDGYGAELDPILPTMGTQVVRTSASSATLQELQDIQFSSFEGGVAVDTANGVSGTSFPVGTGRRPVNNLQDALEIANERGLNKLFIRDSITINSGLDFSNFIFIGDGTQAAVNVQSAAQLDSSEFRGMQIKGVFDGYAKFIDCIVENVTYVDGIMENCSIRGSITLTGTRSVSIINCWDDIPGFGVPTIDVASSGSAVIIRGYRGGLLIKNKTGPEDMSIDMDSARVILDSTITNGSIIVRGVGHLTDNTTGSATVDSDNVVNPGTTSNAALKKVLPFLDD